MNTLVYEVCPKCGNEVKLNAKLEWQECPKCKRPIKPCAMCDMDTVDCATCKLEEEE